MATAPPPASPPRYRGLSGAVRYGLFLFSICLTVAVLGGVLLAGMTGDFGAALQLILRIGAVALILSAGVTFCRWVSGGTADRLVTHRISRGDLGAFGLVVGLLAAGALSMRPTGIGEPVEIAGPTLDGKTLDLADYRGKVVLVDFWATWCPPCVAELPNLKATYDRYHAQGFEVVAVSLDFQRAALAKFVQARNLPWPQIFFPDQEKPEFRNPLSEHYHVQYIPHTLLVGPDGKLLEAGLRGPQVEQAVARALGEPASAAWQDRLGEAGVDVLRWMFNGLLIAPWWLLVLTCWGGALVAVLIEVGLRFTFGRRGKVATPAWNGGVAPFGEEIS
jgi:thiol-disulfide isomerase/thioredoxin